jgi:hypothetical protein
MLDPRIYRMGLIPVLLAVIVFAFSLGNQQPALNSNLAPVSYSGGTANATMDSLAKAYPNRRPGSAGDSRLAAYIGGQMKQAGFSVSTDSFKARTVDGTRTLENVTGTRAGLGAGSIVLVADRSALHSPDTAALSGTAVLLELANVLSGQTLQRTVVLASVSGSAGNAGALQLARSLPQPVDAVIVLGDLAGASIREPLVVPWSNGQSVAPTVLRNTVGAALENQTQWTAGSVGLGGQIAHLAFPMSASAQAPFGDLGDPAVLLSVSGERGTAANERTSLGQISGLGAAVVQAVQALEAGPPVAAPSDYLSFDGKTIPRWAVAFLVLTMIIAVLLATIDGLARARRRGHPILRWVGWVLAAAVPFVVAVLVVGVAKAAGLIEGVVPAPIGGDAVTVHGGASVLLVVLGVVIVGGTVWLRPLIARAAGPRPGQDEDGVYGAGAAAGLLLVLCLVALAIWVANPFAAALLVPALHLWLWIIVPDVRVPVPAMVVLLAAGLAAPVLAVLYYALTLGLDPVQLAWSWVLLLGGGVVGLLTALEWSVFLGCAVSVVAIAIAAARQPRPEAAPVTIRGPVSYAGPGSLGGTESALRR